jgi:hypothetical protein
VKQLAAPATAVMAAARAPEAGRERTDASTIAWALERGLWETSGLGMETLICGPHYSVRHLSSWCCWARFLVQEAG